MILYGSSMSNGNQHDHDPLPVVIAGGASGRLQGDRHIVTPPHTPMSNLLLGDSGQTGNRSEIVRRQHRQTRDLDDDSKSKLSRREALAAATRQWRSCGLFRPGGRDRAGALPLHTTGLEHIGMTVPDQKASAEWYGRIFDPQLFQERDPPPRFYVRMGTAYIAFGGTPATDPTPKIDHFCALVKDYKPDEMRAAIEKAGITMGAGRLGMPTDDDGIRLQLLGVPGGLARTIIPSTRITTDDAAVAAVGLDHIALAVSDIERASAHYAKFFGPPGVKKSDQVSFQIVNTRLVLEPVVIARQTGHPAPQLPRRRLR